MLKEFSFTFFSGHELKLPKTQECRVPDPPRLGTDLILLLSCRVFLNIFLLGLKNRILGTQRIISVWEYSALRYKLHKSPSLSPPLGLKSDRSFPGKFGILAKAEQSKFCFLLRIGPNLSPQEVSYPITRKSKA